MYTHHPDQAILLTADMKDNVSEQLPREWKREWQTNSSKELNWCLETRFADMKSVKLTYSDLDQCYLYRLSSDIAAVAFV